MQEQITENAPYWYGSPVGMETDPEIADCINPTGWDPDYNLAREEYVKMFNHSHVPAYVEVLDTSGGMALGYLFYDPSHNIDDMCYILKHIDRCIYWRKEADPLMR